MIVNTEGVKSLVGAGREGIPLRSWMRLLQSMVRLPWGDLAK